MIKGYCKLCKAVVIWAQSTNGRDIALDQQLSPKGNMILEHDFAKVVDRGLYREGTPLYIAHHATCQGGQ